MEEQKAPISPIIYKIISFFNIIVFAFMLIMELTNIVLRVFFKSGIAQSTELSSYSLVIFTFLGMVVAFKENSHVSFDLLSSGTSKWTKISKVLSSAITLLTLLTLLIFSTRVTIGLYKAGLGGISVPWLHTWIIHLFLPIGFLLSVLTLILSYRVKKR